MEQQGQVKDPSDAVGFTEALGEHATFPDKPSTAGDTLILLGKKWKVSADENRIKAAFEGWVRGNAREAISEADRNQLPDEAAMMRSAYSMDFSAGLYTWEGRAVRNARGDIPGMKQLLYLMLLRCHPEITEELVADMFDENLSACLMAVMWSLGNFKSSVRRRKTREAAAPGTNGTKPPTETTSNLNIKPPPPTLDDD